MNSMATCGKCTATNVTVEHVRACYASGGVVVATQPSFEERLAAERARIHGILHGDKPRQQPYRSTYYASPYERRGEATHPVELPDPADELAHFNHRMTGERLHRAHANTQAQSNPWANVDKLRAEVANHLHYETGQGGSRKRIGHFAIEAEGTLKFLRVKKILSGRYANRVFVDSMGSGTGYPVKRPDTLEAYLAAILVDPGAAALRYATELGQCSDCGRPLTNEESRARGIGPDCWAKR